MQSYDIGSVKFGDKGPFTFIGGPCVIEDYDLTLEIATELKRVCEKLSVPFIFKASFDKANRSSLGNFRGPGIEKGLDILGQIKEQLNVPIVSDIHDISQIEPAAEVLDCIQIPAFLCRQTDLLVAAGKSGVAINLKKGQFMAPWDMKNALDKLQSSGNTKISLTERGASFGYNNLVVDMRSLVIMRNMGAPVVFDATHSVQLPGGQGSSSDGQREFVVPLSRAAIATGIDALFWEVHPSPSDARCDGPNSIQLETVETELSKLVTLHNTIHEITQGQK